MADQPEILREYRVNLVPTSESEPFDGKKLGVCTKFGGTPDEVQPGGPEKMFCPACRQKMHFVAQIDSFEHDSEESPNHKDFADQQYMFGDVGMIYVWFCFDCLEAHATMECY